MKKIMKNALVAFGMFCVANIANAIPVVWNIEGMYGDKISGVFTYDADTNTYSDILIHTPGFGDITTASISSSSPTQFKFDSNLGQITFMGALTNAGGYLEGLGLHPRFPAFVMYYSVQSVATPVPEPETYASILAGLALLGFVVRRRGA